MADEIAKAQGAQRGRDTIFRKDIPAKILFEDDKSLNKNAHRRNSKSQNTSRPSKNK
uniref:Uncharacterized protein n=1 Tax=Oncorhynchus kisutch TaxID=8019 RepID=A0A8C7IV00_ONCKI